MSRRSMFLLAMVFVVAGVAAVGFSVSGSDDGPTAEGTGLDLPLVYRDGTVGNVADFVGRPVVLNFWASWCPACVAEMPDFQRVHAELGDQVVFIGVNMQEVDQVAADALIEQTGVTYLLAEDPDGTIFRSFDGIAMPTSVFISAQGAVVDIHGGAIFTDDLLTKIRRDLLGS